MKNYDELMLLTSFHERRNYLRVRQRLGAQNMDVDRYFAEQFYRSGEWKKIRRTVLIRDKFCDLAIEGLDIPSGALIHHINPISMDDILQGRYSILFDPSNLITCSLATHNDIHYGSVVVTVTERFENDHIPWKPLKKGDD